MRPPARHWYLNQSECDPIVATPDPVHVDRARLLRRFVSWRWPKLDLVSGLAGLGLWLGLVGINCAFADLVDRGLADYPSGLWFIAMLAVCCPVGVPLLFSFGSAFVAQRYLLNWSLDMAAEARSCLACGYSLRGVPCESDGDVTKIRCPECGQVWRRFPDFDAAGSAR